MKSREELIDNLVKVIGASSDDDTVIKKMQQVYVDKKMPIRDVGKIFKGFTPLDNLDFTELGIWCVYLHEVTQDKIIEPTNYFTDNEIYEFKQYVERNKFEMRTDTIIFHNVLKVIENGKVEYRCGNINNYDLYLFTSNNLITYNFNTQREAKIIKYKNKTIRQANINKKSVKAIGELIVKGRFSGNMLTFNIRRPDFCDEGVSFKEYYPNSNFGDLKITPDVEKGIFLDILDGQHRLNGNSYAKELADKKGIKLEGGFLGKIAQFNEDEAQDYINIQNEQNRMNEEHSKSYAKDDINVFIETLNRTGMSSTNTMYNKIVRTIDEVEMYKKYTTINILNDGFRLSGLKFNIPQTNKEYREYFINIFNIIIGFYQSKYDNNFTTIKKISVALEPNVFVGYIALGKQLLDDKNYEQTLTDMLKENKINLNRNSYNWEKIDMYKKNPHSFKKIYDYFSKLV